MVIYPISAPDPDTGLALINWIAEVTYDDPSARDRTGWYNRVEIDDFIHYFEDWTYDWLDVPALIRGADAAYENPMIDRDPVPTWVDGPVALMGDAAHPMYPTGSNGASQAIIDARVLGAKFIEDIETVVPRDEREEFMARYKAAAGFARDTLNAAPPTIAPGLMVRG